MEVNYELEEGEAYYYKEDDDHIDPDIDLSYIDEKIQNVLGHFQKEFEGVVTAENLGAKFGGYGSFLPMYERTPSNWPSSKAPQTICHTEKSPSRFSKERALGNLPIPSTAPFFERPETGSHDLKPMDDSARPLGTRMKCDSAPPSPPPNPKADSKNGKSTKPSMLNNHRPLTVRIKVSCDNSAIYSGLGLDNSPSSSFEDCPSVGKGRGSASPAAAAAHESADESPTRIIEVMTSFPVLGGSLISPLPLSMLNLKPLPAISTDGEQKPLLRHQAQCSSPVNECVSGLDSEPSNEPVASSQGKRETTHQQPVMTEKDTSANQNQYQKSGGDLCESSRVMSSSKSCTKKKTPRRVASAGGQEELCPGKEKALLPERKKNGIGSCKEAMNLLPRDSLKITVNACNSTASANSDDSRSRGRMDVPKSQRAGSSTPLKDVSTTNKARDQSLSLKPVPASSHGGSSEMASGDKPSGKPSMRQNVPSSALEKRFSGNAVDHQPPHVAPDRNAAAPEMLLPSGGGGPVLIEENWVCCDSCQKWRLLPFGTKPEHLPEKWLCRMLTWLPGMNRCDISEEATTKALNALYHVPVTGSSVQNNQQSLSNGSSKVGNLVHHHQHPDLNGQSVDSNESAKKKHNFKRIEKFASHNGAVHVQVQPSSSAKNHLQESIKSRSLDGVSQFVAESNKPTVLSAENPRLNARGSSINGGSENEQSKSRNKRELDQFVDNEISKKCKIDDHGGDHSRVPVQPVNSRNGSSSSISEKCCKKSSQSLEARSTKNGRMENRLLISLKKPGEQALMASRPTCLAVDEKNEVSVKQKRSGEGLDNKNSPHRNFAENSGNVLEMEKKGGNRQMNSSKKTEPHQNLDGTDSSRREIIRCRRLSPVDSASSSPSDRNKRLPLDDANEVANLSNGCVETVDRAGRNAKSVVHGKGGNQSEVKKEGTRSSNGGRRFKVEEEADLVGKSGSSTAGNCSNLRNSSEEKMDETRADVMQAGPRIENSNLIARSNKKEKNEIRQNHSRRDDSPPSGGGRRHEISGGRGNSRSVDLHASSLRATNFRQTVTNTLKEAEELRSTAVRLKDAGFDGESGEAYFQSALKFLYGASLVEPCHAEEEMMQIQVYHTAAKLAELCALEYEGRLEMTVASLAYKCMEVACWRIVCCKNSSCSRDRNELQTIMQTVPQGSGESPSSSASDVDNLNNQAAADKTMLAKVTVSQATRTPAIVARNHPNFLRLLDFTQDVNSAMEASKKSLAAFSSAGMMNSKSEEVLTCVKKAVDFSFQDVEAFIRLVQHAMDAITRHDFFSSRN